MSDSPYTRFWVVALIVIAALLWLFSTVLLPFVAGMAIAYFLDPLVDRMERSRLPRWAASMLVLLSFALAVLLALLILVPLIETQITGLINALPGFVDQFRNQALPKIQNYIKSLPAQDIERIRQEIGNFTGTAVQWAGNLVTTILSGSLALFDILSLLFITPIVAFYLLRDWERLVAKADSLLPRPHAQTIRNQMREIDHTLAGFLRGQAMVCVVMGTYYGVGLTVVGLPFGAAIGIVAGFLTFIPYVGSMTGFITSVLVAFFHYETYTGVAVVIGVFLVGQAVEGNYLTPKLVGERVGLHPVWVIFALLAGGSLFGFLGVLLAVPVAAAIGVLVRFAANRYLESGYYSGEGALPPPADPKIFIPPEVPGPRS